MTEELKLTPLQLGWIEGIAISLAFASKIISGILSDYFKKRKPLLLIGTLLTFIIKALFALATNGWWLFFARSLDRLAKGVRSSPVDALIADIASKDNQGKAYGLRQSLYTFGAVIGSLLASYLLVLTSHNYRFVFWMALIPIFIAFWVVFFFTEDFLKIPNQNSKTDSNTWRFKDIFHLKKSFWQVILVSFILMFSRFSDSFLALKGRSIGLSIAMLPLFTMAYELIHSFSAFPLGWLSDKVNRLWLLFWGIFVLILTNGVMYLATSPTEVFIGYILGGLHMGMTHSLISALIAQNSPTELKGTAFSVYYFTTGIAIFITNPLMGYLSHHFSKSSPFLAGFIFSCLSILCLGWIIFRSSKEKNL